MPTTALSHACWSIGRTLKLQNYFREFRRNCLRKMSNGFAAESHPSRRRSASLHQLQTIQMIGNPSTAGLKEIPPIPPSGSSKEPVTPSAAQTVQPQEVIPAQLHFHHKRDRWRDEKRQRNGDRDSSCQLARVSVQILTTLYTCTNNNDDYSDNN